MKLSYVSTCIQPSEFTQNSRATQTDGLDTEGQQLDDVAAVADTTVSENLGLLKDLGGVAAELVGNLEGRGRVVDLATTVVGQPDTVSTLLNGLEGILGGGDALKDDRELGVRLDLIEEFPLWMLVV